MAFSRTLYWLALCLLPLSVWADKAETCDRLYDAAKYREAMACYMQPDVRNDPGMMNRIGYMHNEGQGVHPELLDLCDTLIKIEMEQFESLNVAIAGGILMYTLRSRFQDA